MLPRSVDELCGEAPFFFFSVAAVLVLSAGLVVGRLSIRIHPAAPQAADHGRGWFYETLNLTPDQKKNVDGIWADVKQQMDKDGSKRQSLDHDRDAAIRALLTPEQSTKYDKIFVDHRAGRAELDKDRERLLRSGNEKTRALLTPEQQVKWDAMSKDMHDHHGPGGPGGPGGRRNNPATQPGSALTGAGAVKSS